MPPAVAPVRPAGASHASSYNTLWNNWGRLYFYWPTFEGLGPNFNFMGESCCMPCMPNETGECLDGLRALSPAATCRVPSVGCPPTTTESRCLSPRSAGYRTQDAFPRGAYGWWFERLPRVHPPNIYQAMLQTRAERLARQ
jgi:hypothetical protein